MIGLIDVDGKLPNLALMKISNYYKRMGEQVVPLVAKALIEVNAPYLIRWPRTPNLQLMPEPGGQLRFA